MNAELVAQKWHNNLLQAQRRLQGVPTVQKYKWTIYIPLDESKERWSKIATCTTIESVTAIVTGLMADDVANCTLVRIEREDA